jgi:hypothetical protein
MLNIIGDIAGNFKALQALLKKMPDNRIVAVGDLIDRGPDSKEVIEFFMEKTAADEADVLLGNHEHMCIDAVRGPRLYEHGIWLWNGGTATLQSFDVTIETMPEDVIQWMESLPLFLEHPGLFVAHSFPTDPSDIETACERINGPTLDLIDSSIIWNRMWPARMTREEPTGPQAVMQIAGHNSPFGLRKFADDQGVFAICIDSSREQVLTGIHWPTLEIFQQEYIDDTL